VWGTDVYTDDSALAVAAVHAGVLLPGEQAVVRVTILPGQQQYQGSLRNGVVTGDWRQFDGSFRIEPMPGKGATRTRPAVLPPASATPRGMYMPLLSGYRGQVGKSFFIEVTGEVVGTVWGKDVYTDDSALGAAAVHAGVLRLGQRGVVKVTILPGQDCYLGCTRNGVTSSPYASWNGSFKVEAAPAKPSSGSPN
jgi:hypothetical protein